MYTIRVVKPVRLFTVRHGETDSARERRFTGTRDVPLTPRGFRQCEAVAQALDRRARALRRQALSPRARRQPRVTCADTQRHRPSACHQMSV